MTPLQALLRLMRFEAALAVFCWALMLAGGLAQVAGPSPAFLAGVSGPAKTAHIFHPSTGVLDAR